MNPEIIRLLGLISLRALAEYDTTEYRRSTDMSKSQIDTQIKSMIEEVNSPECTRLYKNLNNIVDVSEGPLELSFLLRQIYTESFGQAQYYSLQRSRAERSSDYIEAPRREYSQEIKQRIGISEGDELIRLSTMLLLRDLRDYTYSFHRRFGEAEIDSVLEPGLQGVPSILVQAISSKREFEAKLASLRSAMATVQGRAFGVVVMETIPEGKADELAKANIYPLCFDARKNQFLLSDLRSLLLGLREYSDGPQERGEPSRAQEKG